MTFDTIFAYARISRKSQSIERQIRNILALYPDAKIYEEAYTGTTTNGRREFNKLIKRATTEAQAGKRVKIVFDSVSRMSRNAQEGFEIYKELFSLGIELEFIKEPQINTATYYEAREQQIDITLSNDEATNELVNSITSAINRYTMRLAERQVFLAFQQAEKEVEDLHQRTREGILTAKLEGKRIGMEKGRKLTVKKEAPAKTEIKRLSKDFDGTLTDAEVMKIIDIARNTYYKYKRELKEACIGE